MLRTRHCLNFCNPIGYHSPTLLLLLLLLLGSRAFAESDIAVVADKNSPIMQLSREEVAAMFLGKTKSNNEIPVIPIDSDDRKLRERFYLEVANMNSLRIKAYWSRIVFSGQGRPPQELPTEDARARLERDPGVLIYLPANETTLNMKIVFSLKQTSHEH